MGYNITNLDFEKNSETNIQYCSKKTGYFNNLNNYDDYKDWKNPKRIDLIFK